MCRYSPYSITERRVPELIPLLGSQPTGDVSHKPGGREAATTYRQACSYPRNPYEGFCQFCCLVNRGTMGVNRLPKTATRQRRDCDLNPGPSVPESSTLTTRLPSHPVVRPTYNWRQPKIFFCSPRLLSLTTLFFGSATTAGRPTYCRTVCSMHATYSACLSFCRWRSMTARQSSQFQLRCSVIDQSTTPRIVCARIHTRPQLNPLKTG